MNDTIRLSDKETQAVDLILKDSFFDPVGVVDKLGYDKGTFFKYGYFDYLDLRRSDITGVSFQGTRIRHVVLRPDQVSSFEATGPILERAIDVRSPAPQIPSEEGSGPLISEETFEEPIDGLSADDLINLVRNYNPKANAEQITKAYEFAKKMHDGQFRHSGEPFFTHPVAVASILAEQRLDDAIIITGLLHDTIEDTQASYETVAGMFGNEVTRLVEGATNLTNLQLTDRELKQAENLGNLIMAVSKDLRVILVKLADRLHNMRTIKAVRPEQQIAKAQETMYLYAPVSGRLGMQWMREELEDLAFRILNPAARQAIIRRYITLQRETAGVVHRITGEFRDELANAGIEAEVFARAKKPYSIWRKMEKDDVAFSCLSDISGFRIITETEEECYRAAEVVQRCWRPVQGCFRDYISEPKLNGYRSIHVAVLDSDGKRIEAQIQTRAMHEVAEIGVAVCWTYRDGVRSKNPFALDPMKWIANLTLPFGIEEGNEDFLDADRPAFNSDQVFCFTPDGEVVNLPRGATPIDFAYAIHTEIGHTCVGSKIDGVRVPLWTRLKNGQLVEIITADGQSPQPGWLELAATRKARAAIRNALRQTRRTNT